MTMEKVLPLLYHYKSKAQYNITTSNHQTANFFGVEWQLYSTRITMLKWTNRHRVISLLLIYSYARPHNMGYFACEMFHHILNPLRFCFRKIWISTRYEMLVYEGLWNAEIALRYVILSDKRVLGCCQIRLLFALHKCKTVCI